MVKLCNKCGINPRKDSKGGWNTYCKECAKEAAKLSRLRNRDKRLRCEKEYRENNRVEISKRQKDWKNKNKKHVKQYNREYFANYYKNLNNRLAKNLRNRLRQAVVKGYKNGSSVRDLGCSINEFRLYLESKFEFGMSWDNYGSNINCWNMDHIIPLSQFDLTDREQLLRACHYTNLQPMWMVNNSHKCGRKVA